MKPAVPVHFRVGAEGLHHGLIHGLQMVGVLDHMVTFGEHGLHVPVLLVAVGAEVSLIVSAYRTGGIPAVLRVDQNGIVQGTVVVQHRLQHLILHLDQLHGLVNGLLCFTGYNGHCIAYEPHMAVQQQPVTGRGLREGLACHGKPLLAHILIGVDCLNAGNLHGP